MAEPEFAVADRSRGRRTDTLYPAYPDASPVTLAAFAVVMLSLVVLARSWLIAALPVLATIGPHCLPIAAFGVSIYGFRLLLMLLALFSTPLSTRAKWWFNPVARWAIFFGAFWLLYALLSLFWAPNLGRGLGEIVTIVFGFAVILALLSLEAYRPDNLDKLRFGWLIAFLLAAMVGWIEILTDRHLPSPRAEHNLDYFAYSKIVSTMSHTSNFGGFLLLVIPFLIWSMEQSERRGQAGLYCPDRRGWPSDVLHGKSDRAAWPHRAARGLCGHSEATMVCDLAARARRHRGVRILDSYILTGRVRHGAQAAQRGEPEPTPP